MKMIEFLASAFINTFGITQPKPVQLRAASWFIVGLLLLVLVAVGSAGIALHSFLSH